MNTEHIRSLDGLRFVAAFFVLIGHGYWYVVIGQQPDGLTAFSQAVLLLVTIGMTLFFTLSGFVIHLNYAAKISTKPRGLHEFFIARFARLYPLFLVVFGIDFVRLLWEDGYFSGQLFRTRDLFSALPLYLTFTQTWWLWPIGPVSAYEFYGTPTTGATGAMWSLSTEALFYAAYPLLCSFLVRLKNHQVFFFGLIVGALCAAYYLACLLWSQEIMTFSEKTFPQVPPDQLFHWLSFQAPWGRIFEFILGALAAQAYMTGNKLVAYLRGLTYLSLSGFMGVTGLIVIFSGFGAIATSLAAPLLALGLYSISSSRTALSQLLSTRLMVRLGDASYSLYLLHYFVLHEAILHFAYIYPGIPSWVLFFVGVLVSVALAQVSYVLFELPTKRIVRNWFTALRLDVCIPVVICVVTVFCVVASLQLTALNRMTALPVEGRINVLSASFGENCRSSLHDNALGTFRRICNGESKCSFDYDFWHMPDPAGGCLKSLSVIFSCGNGSQRQFVIREFMRAKMPVLLSCAPDPSTSLEFRP